MNRKQIVILFFSAVISIQCMAQSAGSWNGKQAAVVITYDDAIDEHLDNAIPVLDSLQLKASFYVTAYAESTKRRLTEWKALAAKGHELGNHTLYHPCIGGIGREWVKPDYDLANYTVQRMVDEVRMTNTFLQSLDGKTKRTFAFTCGDTKAGGIDFSKYIQQDFVAMRSVRNEMHQLNEVKLADVDCFMVNNHTAEEMIQWVKKAKETNALLVILFHGVGGGNGLNVSIEEHRKFLRYLKQNEKDLWIATMIDVAEYVQQKQQTK
jgi:peptidoglycan/xylan/chitin deacetylase (PgdA/CDA1 family)